MVVPTTNMQPCLHIVEVNFNDNDSSKWSDVGQRSQNRTTVVVENVNQGSLKRHLLKTTTKTDHVKRLMRPTFQT